MKRFTASMLRHHSGIPIAWVSLLTMMLLPAGKSLAHPISQSSVTADVFSNRVEVTMEIKLEDLAWFQNLKTNATAILDSERVKKAAKMHQQFLIDYFHIIDSRSTDTYLGEPKGLRLNTDDPLTTADFESKRIDYTYVFTPPLTRDPGLPRYLTFWQDFGGDKAPVPSEMELQVKQAGAWITRSVNLSQLIPHTVVFDWTKGSSGPRSLSEIRQLKATRNMESLGMGDLNAAYSFIYPLRHQLVLPSWTFETLLNPYRSTNGIVPDQSTPLTQTVLMEWLKIHHRAFIGDESVSPKLISWKILDLATKDPGAPVNSRIPHHKQARLALTLDFPEGVTHIEWNAFNKSLPFLKTLVFDSPMQQPRRAYFTAQKTKLAINPSASESVFVQVTNTIARAVEQTLSSTILPSEFRSEPTPARTSPNQFMPATFDFKLQDHGRYTGELAIHGTTAHWGHVHHWLDQCDAEISLFQRNGKWRLKSVRWDNRRRLSSGVEVSTVKATKLVR